MKGYIYSSRVISGVYRTSLKETNTSSNYFHNVLTSAMEIAWATIASFLPLSNARVMAFPDAARLALASSCTSGIMQP